VAELKFFSFSRKNLFVAKQRSSKEAGEKIENKEKALFYFHFLFALLLRCFAPKKILMFWR